jgi:hypothetical protein
MKKISQTKNENIQFETKKNRPEVRDDLDSRKNEEFDFKGDDVTHNQKETKKDKQKKQN